MTHLGHRQWTFSLQPCFNRSLIVLAMSLPCHCFRANIFCLWNTPIIIYSCWIHSVPSDRTSVGLSSDSNLLPGLQWRHLVCNSWPRPTPPISFIASESTHSFLFPHSVGIWGCWGTEQEFCWHSHRETAYFLTKWGPDEENVCCWAIESLDIFSFHFFNFKASYPAVKGIGGGGLAFSLSQQWISYKLHNYIASKRTIFFPLGSGCANRTPFPVHTGPIHWESFWSLEPGFMTFKIWSHCQSGRPCN